MPWKKWCIVVVFHVLAMVETCSGQDAHAPRSKLFIKAPISLGNSNVISHIESADIHVQPFPYDAEAASLLQDCSLDSDCDYAGCSDTGHAWGCGVAGMHKCYFLPQMNDSAYCKNLCTDALHDAQGKEYRASFCWTHHTSDIHAVYVSSYNALS
jgi:hypothetical protein